MKNSIVTSVVVSVLLGFLLSGCSTHIPQNAEEFRKYASGSTLTKHKSYEVDRPFKKVAADLRKKGAECLNVRIAIPVGSSGMATGRVSIKATVNATKEKVELSVQQLVEGHLFFYNPPDGGHYILVADAKPLAKKKTKIDVYHCAMGFCYYPTVVKAIEGWAKGTVKGCPDMTK